MIHAYGEIPKNLELHAKGWPTIEDLDQHVVTGQPAYGMAATGKGKSSPGSNALLKAIQRDDSRPLWICIWGGANTLAQALMDLRSSKSTEERVGLFPACGCTRFSDQDDAGPWIRHEFPELSYIVDPSRPNSESYYHATWTGISGDVLLPKWRRCRY